MKKILNNKKYDTDNASLLAVWTNPAVDEYLRRLEEWHDVNDFEDEGESEGEETPPTDEEPESGDDGDEEEPEIPELKEEDEDDFVFLSLANSQDVDFDFDDYPTPPIKDDGEIDMPDDPKEPDEPVKPEPIEVPDFVWPDPVDEVRISPLWEIERLYQKKSTGEYFRVVEGGYMSRWPKPQVRQFLNYSEVSRGVDPYYDEKLAFEWAVRHLSVDQVESIFGEVEE